jgi:hypothetical protein
VLLPSSSAASAAASAVGTGCRCTLGQQTSCARARVSTCMMTAVWALVESRGSTGCCWTSCAGALPCKSGEALALTPHHLLEVRGAVC